MAKPLSWYLDAAWRTVLAALPALARPDDAWAQAQLGAAEFELYRQLPAPERVHAVTVAQRLLRTEPRAASELVRAALLHDVGKLGTPGCSRMCFRRRALRPNRACWVWPGRVKRVCITWPTAPP